MKKLLMGTFILLTVFSVCSSSLGEIVSFEYKYEKTIYDKHNFEFEFHFENIKDSERLSGLVTRLIYDGKSIEDFKLFQETGFIGEIDEANYLPMIDDDGTEYFFRSYLNKEYRIAFFNESFIIVSYFTYEYHAGGAHGNYWYDYYIINVSEERLLALNELIKQVPDELLKEMINEKYEINGYLRENIWPPNAITFNNKIKLLWNTYTITPYSDGVIEIELPDAIGEQYLSDRGKQILALTHAVNPTASPTQ